jgi:hypothetical protein
VFFRQKHSQNTCYSTPVLKSKYLLFVKVQDYFISTLPKETQNSPSINVFGRLSHSYYKDLWHIISITLRNENYETKCEMIPFPFCPTLGSCQ